MSIPTPGPNRAEQGTAVKWEHAWLSLQWHAGVMGMGKGWDNKMIVQIEELGRSGYEMCGVVQQKDPTWFILFFKRIVS